MSDLNEKIKLFYRKKMQQNKLREKMKMLSRQKDKKSQIALQKLQKKLKYQFIVTDRQLIIKKETGEDDEIIDRQNTAHIYDEIMKLEGQIKKQSEEDIITKYDILFEFQDLKSINEENLLKQFQEKEKKLVDMMNAKRSLLKYRQIAVQNFESEINNIHTSLSVLTESLKEEKNKSERSVLYKRYNDHHKRLLDVKEKLIALENVPDIQISALHK